MGVASRLTLGLARPWDSVVATPESPEELEEGVKDKDLAELMLNLEEDSLKEFEERIDSVAKSVIWLGRVLLQAYFVTLPIRSLCSAVRRQGWSKQPAYKNVAS